MFGNYYFNEIFVVASGGLIFLGMFGIGAVVLSCAYSKSDNVGLNIGLNSLFVVTQLLCILTSFQVLAAPESWSKHFFQPFFDLFC